MIEINPIEIKGVWNRGWVLDLHTISSELAGYDEFGHEVSDTKRSPLGEALYTLKYKLDKTPLSSIAETVANFLINKGVSKKISALIVVPAQIPLGLFNPILR